MTLKQVKNYVSDQHAHPKETTEDGDGNGLALFEDNKPYYIAVQNMTRKSEHLKRFNNETLVNEDLDEEAQQATRNAANVATSFTVTGGGQNPGASAISIPAPFIPATPLTAFRNFLSPAATAKRNAIAAAEPRGPFNEPVRFYPITLFTKLKSAVFKGALPVLTTPLAHRATAAPITPVVTAAATIPAAMAAAAAAAANADAAANAAAAAGTMGEGSDTEEDNVEPDGDDLIGDTDEEMNDAEEEGLNDGQEAPNVPSAPVSASTGPPTQAPSHPDSITTYLAGLNGQQMGDLMNHVRLVQQQALNTWQQNQHVQAAVHAPSAPDGFHGERVRGCRLNGKPCRCFSKYSTATACSTSVACTSSSPFYRVGESLPRKFHRVCTLEPKQQLPATDS